MSGGGADWVLGGEAGEGAGVGRHGCCVVILDFREGRKEGYTTFLWQIQSAKRPNFVAIALIPLPRDAPLLWSAYAMWRVASGEITFAAHDTDIDLKEPINAKFRVVSSQRSERQY